jgi:hypothetical protein
MEMNLGSCALARRVLVGKDSDPHRRFLRVVFRLSLLGALGGITG